jgi:hypothetical protein
MIIEILEGFWGIKRFKNVKQLKTIIVGKLRNNIFTSVSNF